MARKSRMYIGTNKVYQLPSGSYNVKISSGIGEDGKYHNKSITRPTIQQLKEAIAEYEQSLKEEKRLQSITTVRQAVSSYIQTGRLSGMSPSTIASYERILRNGYGEIADMDILQLTVPIIQNQLNLRAAVVSPKTVSNEYGLLHKVLTIYNPDLRLDHKIVLPSKRNDPNGEAGIVIPDDNMIKKAMSFTREHDPDLYKAILISSQTGLRRSQLCALTWDDLNIKDHCITITKALVLDEHRQWQLKAPKSRSSRRTISVSPVILNELQKYRSDSVRIISCSPDIITQRWCRLRDRLSIPGRFHDLRHYHASVLIELGVPESYAMHDMGHSTPGLYKRVYGHLMPQKKQQMYAALTQHQNTMLDNSSTDSSTTTQKPNKPNTP